MEDNRKAFRILIGKLLGKSLLQDREEYGGGGGCLNAEIWMELAQDRIQWRVLVLVVLNLHVLLPLLVNWLVSSVR
jgi:hypothetical protein